MAKTAVKKDAAPSLAEEFEQTELSRFMEAYDVADARRAPSELKDVYSFPSAIFMHVNEIDGDGIRAGQCVMLMAERAGQSRNGPLFKLTRYRVDVAAAMPAAEADEAMVWNRVDYFLKRHAVPAEATEGRALVLSHDQSSLRAEKSDVGPFTLPECLALMRDFARQMNAAALDEVFFPAFYRDYPTVAEIQAFSAARPARDFRIIFRSGVS